MTFDTIISNPPYQGSKQLHQRFFNWAVDNLVEGGVQCFIQPATAYLNKGSGKSDVVVGYHHRLMQQHLRSYRAIVTFRHPNVFGVKANLLAMTTLVKTHSCGLIESVRYLNTTRYENVELDDINAAGMCPQTFRSISAKYRRFIKSHGSLSTLFVGSDRKHTPTQKYLAKVNSLQGNVGESDWFTIYYNAAQPGSIYDDNKQGILVASEQELLFFHTYARTFIARMGVALVKFNGSNYSLKTVPLVPFDRHWTDEALAELIGLTAEELEVIRTTLPDYHNLLTS